MSAERAFYNRLRPHLPGHVCRVENSAGSGMPDVNLCWEGQEAWIELKVWTPGAGCLLRKEQYAWGIRRGALGGRVYVLCDLPDAQAVGMWRFPDVHVVPYGTSEKYVSLLATRSHRSYSMEWIKKFLKTLLFT